MALTSATDIGLTPFEFQSRTRLVFQENAVDRAGSILQELGAHRVFVVTDPGIVAAGIFDRLMDSLNETGLETLVFDQVRENPTTHDVADCMEVARSEPIDLIVGLGGGSSLDTAKSCNFLLTNGGRMQDYWGYGKATKPMLPLVAVPTTAGTGSECQSYALISDEETHRKMACGDPKAAPKVSILDPTLTLTQPREVAACTGLDAIAHAVESAVTTKRSPVSWLFSREAFRLTASNFPTVLENPQDMQARGAMLLGAAFSGIAIENSMLGAAHACANPLTARFGTTHGRAVGIMLPHVVRFNGQLESSCEYYRQLARDAGLAGPNQSGEEAIDTLASELTRFLRLSSLPHSLDQLGVASDDLDDLAENAANQWTGQFNPRSLAKSDFFGLYEAAYAE